MFNLYEIGLVLYIYFKKAQTIAKLHNFSPFSSGHSCKDSSGGLTLRALVLSVYHFKLSTNDKCKNQSEADGLINAVM